MTAWTNDELRKIGEAEELRIELLRSDGTLRNQVIIWVIRLGDDLYVRSVSGPSASWFRGVQTHHEGHIRAGGIYKDVILLEEPDSMINDQIDAIYNIKYQRHAASIIGQITSSQARSATIKLVPVADA
jgi:hypothetical protein